MGNWILHALEPIQAVCSDWCLHFWEVVGIWFTGIATFAAVLVSLALARREGIRFTISAQVMSVVRPGVEGPFPEVLHISVRNVGSRPARIEGVAWRRRPWSSRYGLQLFYPEGGFPGPPVTVEPGNRHSFSLPLDDPRVEWHQWFIPNIVGRWPRVGVHLVRVLAYTPAGDQCSAFLDSSLKEWLIEKAESVASQPPAET
jgi:hypothetical protein